MSSAARGVTYVSARSWDASEEDMVKRGDWRDSEVAWTEATRSSQEKQKLVRGIMVEVRVASGPTCHSNLLNVMYKKSKTPPWFEHGTARSAIVCSTTELWSHC
jgi:hypothetical protein